MDVYDHSYDYLCAVLLKRQELKVVHEGYVDVLDLPEQRPPPPTQECPSDLKFLQLHVWVIFDNIKILKLTQQMQITIFVTK